MRGVNPISSAICSAGIPTASRIARNHPSGGRDCDRAFLYQRTLRSKSNLACSRNTFLIAHPFSVPQSLVPQSLSPGFLHTHTHTHTHTHIRTHSHPHTRINPHFASHTEIPIKLSQLNAKFSIHTH
jgi:hypothetical protein